MGSVDKEHKQYAIDGFNAMAEEAREMETKTLQNFLDEALPLLLSGTVTKMESQVVEGFVSAYRVVHIIRIDLKPKED